VTSKADAIADAHASDQIFFDVVGALPPSTSRRSSPRGDSDVEHASGHGARTDVRHDFPRRRGLRYVITDDGRTNLATAAARVGCRREALRWAGHVGAESPRRSSMLRIFTAARGGRPDSPPGPVRRRPIVAAVGGRATFPRWS